GEGVGNTFLQAGYRVQWLILIHARHGRPKRRGEGSGRGGDAGKERHFALGDLLVREVSFWAEGRIQADSPDIPHHADHREPGAVRASSHPKALAERILSGPESAHERFVYHDHLFTLPPVILGEAPAPPKRNPQGLEVLRC